MPGHRAIPAATAIPNIANRNSEVIAQAMVRLLLHKEWTVPPLARRANAVSSGSRRKPTGERHRAAPPFIYRGVGPSLDDGVDANSCQRRKGSWAPLGLAAAGACAARRPWRSEPWRSETLAARYSYNRAHDLCSRLNRAGVSLPMAPILGLRLGSRVVFAHEQIVFGTARLRRAHARDHDPRGRPAGIALPGMFLRIRSTGSKKQSRLAARVLCSCRPTARI
jgi:hypothetical protein